MDIAALSMAMASADVATSVNISLMKKSQENMELVGQQVSDMIAATSIDTGSIIDISI